MRKIRKKKIFKLYSLQIQKLTSTNEKKEKAKKEEELKVVEKGGIDGNEKDYALR